MTGKILHIHVSDGGVPKLPLDKVEITTDGLVGDRQKNLKYHGGPDRAVCLWSQEIITTLQSEGHPIGPGSTGENITVGGLDWSQMEPGVQLCLGDSVTLAITDYAQPCRTIARYFNQRRYGRISQKRNPGTSRIYAKVLSSGAIQVGDAIAIV